MPLDLARGHSPRVERKDLVIEAVKAGLTLFDELRLKLPVAVTRDFNRDLSLLTFGGLARLAVAGITGVLPIGRVFLVTEMMRQFTVEDPFNEGFGELLEQTALTEHVFGFLVVFQKLIEDFFSEDRKSTRLNS